MSNITEDLRRYREIEPLFELSRLRLIAEIKEESFDPDWPEWNDPRITEGRNILERIENLSIESDSVVIEDRELHQLFHQLRKSSSNSALNQGGGVVSDDLFEKLMWEYHPQDFVKRMLVVPPLVTLIDIPKDVIDLLAEARKAYCLRLPTACISVCRSTVERAVVDIAVRIGILDPDEAPEELRMCAKISSLIAADLTHQSPLRRKIDQFLGDSSRVIHTAERADAPGAQKLYAETLVLIQMLYGTYASQLKK